jgi:O-antigen biosynthesis protein
VNEIMPLVWRDAHEVQRLIVGSDISDDLRRELARPRVKVLGRVERLTDVFERVRLTVAPLRFGAGLKDKVLRSLSAGLPCVGTPEAFSGMYRLPATIQSNCCGDSASDLAGAIVRMHRDEATSTICGQIGLDYIAEYYNEHRVDALIREVAKLAIERHRGKVKQTSDSQVLKFGTLTQHSKPIFSGVHRHPRRVVFG